MIKLVFILLLFSCSYCCADPYISMDFIDSTGYKYATVIRNCKGEIKVTFWRGQVSFQSANEIKTICKWIDKLETISPKPVEFDWSAIIRDVDKTLKCEKVED